MIPQPHAPKQASTPSGPSSDPHAEACRYCGVIDRPLLSAGVGPHKCQASCAHCGKHLHWVSMHSPSERQARRVRERMKAMHKLPPTEAQLSYLLALGDVQAPPQTMAEASERIDRLVRDKAAQP